MKEEKKEDGKKRTPLQRILAIAGIVLLVALYVVTFVAALTSSPSSNGLFLASLTLTFVIPAAIYITMWIMRVWKRDEE